MSQWMLAVRLAVQTLFARRSNLVLGLCLVVVSFVLALMVSLLATVRTGTAQSIRGTLAGDLQLYSKQSRDALAFWSLPVNELEVTPITDFKKLKAAVSVVPGVRHVVPMGLGSGILLRENRLDGALGRVRELLPSKADSDAWQASYGDAKALVRAMVLRFAAATEGETIASNSQAAKEGRSDVEKAISPEFWERFDQAPVEALDFLEGRIVPQMADSTDLSIIRYLGVDFPAFRAAFAQFHNKEGEMVPPGQHGFMLSQYEYEQTYKLKAAHRLDQLREVKLKDGTLADNPDVTRLIEANQQETYDVLFELGPKAEAVVRGALQKELETSATDLKGLLVSFFKMDDSNFDRRFKLFYEIIAPRVRLYRLNIGEEYSIEGFTNRGYSRTVRLKFYGTYVFQGLEKASLSNELLFIDIDSLRELGGFLNESDPRELEALGKAMGPPEKLSRAAIEAALMADGLSVTEAVGQGQGLNDLLGDMHRREARRSFDPATADDGVVLNAAVVLDAPEHAAQAAVEIEKAASASGFAVRVIPGAECAGLIGKVAEFVGYSLTGVAVLLLVIIFVILNNVIIMGTIRRVPEFGAARAMGAQVSLVSWLAFLEVFLVATVAASIGVGVAVLLLVWVQKAGVAGPPDASFFLGGAVLRPVISGAGLAGAWGVVVAVAAISGLYPARLASSVSPVRAMQSAG